MARLTIDVEYLSRILGRLLETPSPAGYTDAIARVAGEELAALGIEYELTRRGAIRARIAGRRRQPARALIAHLDTLGAQVKNLKDNGRLELAPVGHWSARFAEGARCTLFTDTGSFRGTILPLKASGHVYNEQIDTQPTGWEHIELRVDALTRHARDLARLGIAIGDMVAIDPQPEFLSNGFIVSRHLDDKAGCAVHVRRDQGAQGSGRGAAGRHPVPVLDLGGGRSGRLLGADARRGVDGDHRQRHHRAGPEQLASSASPSPWRT